MVTFPAGDWLSVEETMAALGLTRRAVQYLAQAGRIKSTTFLGLYLLDRAAVTAYKTAPSRKVGRPRDVKKKPRR